MFALILKGLIWTGINFALLQLIKYGNDAYWSDWILAIIMIPVGFVNCANLVLSFSRLRNVTIGQLVYFLFGIGNAIYFFYIWNDLQNLGGPMINQ